jgi:hypothetical protein
MRRSTILSFTAFSVAAIVACGGDGGSTGPDGQPNGEFRFTAKIDGAAWASTAGVEQFGVAVVVPGTYGITGMQLGGAGYTIVFQLYNITGPGTYPLGVGVSVPGGSALISTVGGGWRTPQTGADGTISITTLTATRMEGTFNFTAVPFTGNVSGTKTVTDGSFVLELKPQGTIGPVPENAGSTLSATLNGAAYNAAEVAGQYLASSGILAVLGNNDTRSLSISLTGISATGVGTYPLSNGSPNRHIGLTIVNGTQIVGSYHSHMTGSSGSVTITSFTATRIKGTFSGVLGPVAGSGATGPMTITNGTFDIGRP